MRALCFMSCLVVLSACSKDKSRYSGGPELPPNANPKDFQKFIVELKNEVPCNIENFKKSKWKADKYEVDKEITDHFSMAIVKIDPPVVLKDEITGQTKTYSKARMQARFPPDGVTGIYGWKEVEMLP